MFKLSNIGSQLSVEGNAGCDTLDIELLKDGRLELRVGHCCVQDIKYIVPVEFITALLTKVVLDAGGVEEAIRTINWPEEFIDELISKVEGCEF